MKFHEYFKYFNIFSQFSVIVVFSIVFFIWLGSYLDDKLLNGDKVFTIIGIFLGLFSAGFNSYKLYQKYIDDFNNK